MEFHNIMSNLQPKQLTCRAGEVDLIKVTPAPTEDDLQHGCFTDVSFAGTFACAQPEESIQELHEWIHRK